MRDINGWEIDPALDLVLDREIEVAPELVWKVWTEAEHLVHWFCPKPWTVSSCELDPRPGGIFLAVMRSPEGIDMPADPGCYLEVVPHERLVWTDAMSPGFRPKENGFFTAILLLERTPKGTRYIAIAKHKDEEGRKQHEEMGFHDGWGTVLDQLVAYVKTLS